MMFFLFASKNLEARLPDSVVVCWCSWVLAGHGDRRSQTNYGRSKWYVSQGIPLKQRYRNYQDAEKLVQLRQTFDYWLHFGIN